MRQHSMVLLALCLALPLVSYAHTPSLEIFDDPAFTRQSGDMTGTTKTLYLRILTDPTVPGYSRVEFSLTGLEDFDAVTWTWANDPDLETGTLRAGEGDGNELGGIFARWPDCQYEETLMIVTLESSFPPQNRKITVTHKAPPAHESLLFPYFYGCEGSCTCASALSTTSYTLNPVVAVEEGTWSNVKALFR